MDPNTSAKTALELAANTPAILWVTGNVHGDEESGADATLRVVYELAARNDCVVNHILDKAIVVALPIQNPDGREASTRRNAYGFDMNRDWFARTQPETDGKLELLRQYPPVLYIDAHETSAVLAEVLGSINNFAASRILLRPSGVTFSSRPIIA